MVVIISMLLPSTAFASYGYDYAAKFFIAPYTLKAANDAWAKLGLTYSSYYGDNFTKSTFLANAKYGNGVYALAHGSLSTRSIFDGTGTLVTNGKEITTADINTARASDWKKLVFIDACFSSNDDKMSRAWGIFTGDGSIHAYVGWNGCSSDNQQYCDYTMTFWSSVANKNTISYSMSEASRLSGVTNARGFGSLNWRY